MSDDQSNQPVLLNSRELYIQCSTELIPEHLESLYRDIHRLSWWAIYGDDNCFCESSACEHNTPEFWKKSAEECIQAIREFTTLYQQYLRDKNIQWLVEAAIQCGVILEAEHSVSADILKNLIQHEIYCRFPKEDLQGTKRYQTATYDIQDVTSEDGTYHWHMFWHLLDSVLLS